MSQSIVRLVAATLVLGAAVPVFAQEGKPVGLSLRVGAFIPTNDTTKNVSESWFAGGVDYKISGPIFLSLDFGGKGNYRSVPILLNYKIQRGPAYIFGGAGVQFTRRDSAAGPIDKSDLGYEGGIGYDFGQGETPLFLEAKFMGGRVDELNGVGIFAGVRF